jgi:DNA polymerase elongation subunit (family B)
MYESDLSEREPNVLYISPNNVKYTNDYANSRTIMHVWGRDPAVPDENGNGRLFYHRFIGHKPHIYTSVKKKILDSISEELTAAGMVGTPYIDGTTDPPIKRTSDRRRCYRIDMRFPKDTYKIRRLLYENLNERQKKKAHHYIGESQTLYEIRWLSDQDYKTFSKTVGEWEQMLIKTPDGEIADRPPTFMDGYKLDYSRALEETGASDYDGIFEKDPYYCFRESDFKITPVPICYLEAGADIETDTSTEYKNIQDMADAAELPVTFISTKFKDREQHITYVLVLQPPDGNFEDEDVDYKDLYDGEIKIRRYLYFKTEEKLLLYWRDLMLAHDWDYLIFHNATFDGPYIFRRMIENDINPYRLSPLYNFVNETNPKRSRYSRKRRNSPKQLVRIVNVRKNKFGKFVNEDELNIAGKTIFCSLDHLEMFHRHLNTDPDKRPETVSLDNAGLFYLGVGKVILQMSHGDIWRFDHHTARRYSARDTELMMHFVKVCELLVNYKSKSRLNGMRLEDMRFPSRINLRKAILMAHSLGVCLRSPPKFMKEYTVEEQKAGKPKKKKKKKKKIKGGRNIDTIKGVHPEDGEIGMVLGMDFKAMYGMLMKMFNIGILTLRSLSEMSYDLDKLISSPVGVYFLKPEYDPESDSYRRKDLSVLSLVSEDFVRDRLIFEAEAEHTGELHGRGSQEYADKARKAKLSKIDIVANFGISIEQNMPTYEPKIAECITAYGREATATIVQIFLGSKKAKKLLGPGDPRFNYYNYPDNPDGDLIPAEIEEKFGVKIRTYVCAGDTDSVYGVVIFKEFWLDQNEKPICLENGREKHPDDLGWTSARFLDKELIENCMPVVAEAVHDILNREMNKLAEFRNAPKNLLYIRTEAIYSAMFFAEAASGASRKKSYGYHQIWEFTKLGKWIRTDFLDAKGFDFKKRTASVVCAEGQWEVLKMFLLRRKPHEFTKYCNEFEEKIIPWSPDKFAIPVILGNNIKDYKTLTAHVKAAIRASNESGLVFKRGDTVRYYYTENKSPEGYETIGYREFEELTKEYPMDFNKMVEKQFWDKIQPFLATRGWNRSQVQTGNFQIKLDQFF